MSNTFTNLLYHVIFSTKNREPLIAPPLRAELDGYIGGIMRNEGGVLLGIGGTPDHSHLFIKLRADRAVSDAVRSIKSNSSKWASDRFGRFGWQSGYGAFSVSASQVDAVREYVLRQEEHHRVTTFQEEYVQFLRKHGIEFDERYLWD